MQERANARLREHVTHGQKEPGGGIHATWPLPFIACLYCYIYSILRIEITSVVEMRDGPGKLMVQSLSDIVTTLGTRQNSHNQSQYPIIVTRR